MWLWERLLHSALASHVISGSQPPVFAALCLHPCLLFRPLLHPSLRTSVSLNVFLKGMGSNNRTSLTANLYQEPIAGTVHAASHSISTTTLCYR